MKKRINIKRARGQAIAELVIAGAMLGSLLLASATLYQIMQADLTANKAARLASWQGVLYQGLTAPEYQDTFETNMSQTLMQRDLRDLINYEDEALLGSTSDIAYLYESVSPTYAYPSNRSSYIANMAGLNDNTVSGISVSIPLASNAEIFKLPGRDLFTHGEVDQMPAYDPIAGEYRYHVKAKAALLSNGFVPMNETGFTSAISRISADGNPMTFFEVWRSALDFFGFDEIDQATGDAGLSTVATNQSRVLPAELGTFTE